MYRQSVLWRRKKINWTLTELSMAFVVWFFMPTILKIPTKSSKLNNCADFNWLSMRILLRSIHTYTKRTFNLACSLVWCANELYICERVCLRIVLFDSAFSLITICMWRICYLWSANIRICHSGIGTIRLRSVSFEHIKLATIVFTAVKINFHDWRHPNRPIRFIKYQTPFPFICVIKDSFGKKSYVSWIFGFIILIFISACV